MALQPNLNGIPRFGYVVAGLVMMGWGFLFADPGFWHYAWPIVGAVVLIAGIIGFCPLLAMLGVSGKKN
ncbi:MAG: DUF2892 domain-containing protein [Acidobacteria bacterium]|nr:DUF2892 domain-containing protein [Acidobacteriota bacterium]MCL5286653.1 DUF2892 domain-containing protein [Acidobacteriota bacterium]